MICKTCKKDTNITNYKKRPHCNKCRNEYERARYNPKLDRNRHLKYWYGITQDDYDRMMISQNGQCAICGINSKTQKKIFNVDHDHTTGKVRALLCVRCNLSIGLIEDEKWIIKANEYLKNYHGK